MTPKIVFYYSENNEIQYKILRSLDGALDLLKIKSSWPCLIDLTFKPQIASKIQEALIVAPKAAYSSASFYHALSYEGNLICHDEYVVQFADKLSHPIKSMLGQSFLTAAEISALDIDYIKAPTDEINKDKDLHATRLDQFIFSVRTTNVFNREKLLTIGDLVQLSQKELLGLHNLGRKSLREIEDFLAKQGEQLRTENSEVVSQVSRTKVGNTPYTFRSTATSSNMPLSTSSPAQDNDIIDDTELNIIENLTTAISRLSDREQIILKKRIGLNSEPHTLEQLGEEFQVTRERIRQIESKAWSKIVHPAHGWNPNNLWDDALIDALTNSISPLSLHNLMLLDERFRCPEEHYKVIDYLLVNVLKAKIECHKVLVDDVPYYAKCKQDVIDDAYEGICSLLPTMEGQSLVNIEQAVRVILPLEISEFASLLQHIALSSSKITKDGDTEILEIYSTRNTYRPFLRSIFKNLTAPITNSELDEIIQTNYPTKNVRSIRGALNTADNIFPFSHGSWGTIDMLDLTDQEMSFIKKLIKDFIDDLDVDQFHTSKLLDYIKKRDAHISKKIDHWQLSAIGRYYSLSKYLGRNVFTKNENENKRVFIKDLVFDIISNHKRPMKENEIKFELSERNQIVPTQIQAREPVVRVGSGYFSLRQWNAKPVGGGVEYYLENGKEPLFWESKTVSLNRAQWSQTEVEELNDLHDRGYTGRQIADLIDRTPYAVYKALQEYRSGNLENSDIKSVQSQSASNDERTSWTIDRQTRLTSLWASGFSASEIAKDLGSVSRSAVLSKIHRLGLSNRVDNSPENDVVSIENSCSDSLKSSAMWTEAELRKLDVLQDAKYSTEIIAEILGRSLEDVDSQKKKRLGKI